MRKKKSKFVRLINFFVRPGLALPFLKKYETPKPLAEEDKGETLENLISYEFIKYVLNEETEQIELKTSKAGIALMEMLGDN